MHVTEEYEINEPDAAGTHVLIATQGSEFKDKLTDSIIEKMESLNYYIRVVDISKLTSIESNQWDALIVIHTWEYANPPRAVKEFVVEIDDQSKLVLITTSGDGGETIDGVDGIAAASIPTDVEKYAQEAFLRIINVK